MLAVTSVVDSWKLHCQFIINTKKCFFVVGYLNAQRQAFWVDDKWKSWAFERLETKVNCESFNQRSVDKSNLATECTCFPLCFYTARLCIIASNLFLFQRLFSLELLSVSSQCECQTFNCESWLWLIPVFNSTIDSRVTRETSMSQPHLWALSPFLSQFRKATNAVCEKSCWSRH